MSTDRLSTPAQIAAPARARRVEGQQSTPTFSGILEWLGQPFSYYPPLARLVGGVKEAVFLSNLMRWAQRAKGRVGIEDGWIFKSAAELVEETGLTYKEQWGARKTLRNLGIIDERHHRVEHRIYFRVNQKVLNDLWTAMVEGEGHPPKRKGAPSQTEGGTFPKGNSSKQYRQAVLTADQTYNLTGARAIKNHSPEHMAVSKKISKTSKKPTPDPLVAGFDRLWKVIPKRISRGTAKVGAWEVWKLLTPTARHVDEMIRLLKGYLKDVPDGYDLYDSDGSVRVTPAKLIRLLCVAMKDQIALTAVLDEDLFTELTDGASGGTA